MCGVCLGCVVCTVCVWYVCVNGICDVCVCSVCVSVYGVYVRWGVEVCGCVCGRMWGCGGL